MNQIKNNQETHPIEFHITSFPLDRIFILLDLSFHTGLFNRIKDYKFKEFNKNFFDNGLNWNTFKGWRSRKNFILLWFIIQLSEKLPEFPIRMFEENVIAYKGPSSSAIIRTPNLPIKEDARLLKIVAHLLGDGFVGGGFGTKLLKGRSHSEYRNFTPELLDSFQRDLSVFGDLSANKNYKHGSLIIPNVVGYLLECFYKIKFDTFNSRVPKSLFDVPKELVAPFLMAFGDDESHVYDSSIEYHSNNERLLKDILLLMNNAFPEIKTSKIKTNTKAGKNIKYSFSIYHVSQREYLNLIGFDHPKKREDLIFNLGRKGKGGYKDSKGGILRLLNYDNYTAKNLSRILRIRHSTVLDHLSELKNDGKIRVLKKEHWANIWTTR